MSNCTCCLFFENCTTFYKDCDAYSPIQEDDIDEFVESRRQEFYDAWFEYISEYNDVFF